MCGIVAYLGDKPAYPILIGGLQRLEYRGYDSAGIATLIHNGIIENYATLKEGLRQRGHRFLSETDTEVLAHLIEEVQDTTGAPIFDAVRIALGEVQGAYAIAVLDRTQPDVLIAARKSSPLVIGVGPDNDYYVASDATPIVTYTPNVIYLEDEEIARIHRTEGLLIRTIANDAVTPEIHALEMQLEALEKGGFEHFMLKEIFEQPRSITDSIRGRLSLQRGEIKMAGIDDHWERWAAAERIIILGCGTSWHAGLVAEYLLEEFTRIPVEVEYASEFRYRNPIVRPTDVIIAISQSGETADTLAALRLAKSQGAHVFGVCNVVGSSIARETHSGSYTHAGPEIGVASTKAFTAQVAVLTLIALHLGRRLGTLPSERYFRLLAELSGIPDKVQRILEQDLRIQAISEEFHKATNALYLGRGYNFPVALEGALKLKEISYIHAEGYPAAEMKHGPIALIDSEMPVVFIATADEVYDKVVSNIQEVRARGGRLISVITEGDRTVPGLSDHVIEIPRCDDALAPLLTCIPLQLLSYHIAVMRGCNVDQPRNLAKSVTVE